jgi:hypothetical protein
MKRITFHEEAYAEMNEAALNYEERVLDSVLCFLPKLKTPWDKL